MEKNIYFINTFFYNSNSNYILITLISLMLILK